MSSLIENCKANTQSIFTARTMPPKKLTNPESASPETMEEKPVKVKKPRKRAPSKSKGSSDTPLTTQSPGVQPHPIHTHVPPSRLELTALDSSVADNSLLRLFNKLSACNISLQAKLSKRKELPLRLHRILTIINQFDQTNFPVLWMTTNFSMLYSQWVKRTENGDPIRFCPFASPYDKAAVAMWFETFGDVTDLTADSLGDLVTSSASVSQMKEFMGSFQAVWTRDFKSQPPAQLDPKALLQHLHFLFNANEDQADLIENSNMIIRHIIVTFTHLASKSYEAITRNLK